MTDISAPADQSARDAVVARLDETIFLEAGAGSGKTTCLVQRFVALVEAGVAAESIAAITFTEKAAVELADRIRCELRKESPSSPRCREALDGLDRAAIGTLHSFAQRILGHFPIEAGLPPRIEVLDDISSRLEFEARWENFVDRLIEEPQLDRPLRLLLAVGGRLDQLHQVASEFAANWDLVTERAGEDRTAIPEVAVEPIAELVDAAVALSNDCRDPQDLLLARTGVFAEWATSLRGSAADGDEQAVLSLLMDPPGVANHGRAPNWPDVKRVRGLLREAADAAHSAGQRVLDACLNRLAEEIAEFTIESSEARRAAGRLEFHDLLVLSRSVLRDRSHGYPLRRRLAQRYQRILLDEFQDTDPVQIEIAVLIASDDPDAGTKEWYQVAPAPGQLFFVGDPKQSIYRFRRADISVFLRARDTLVQSTERLTANFRTAEPILGWANHTFARLIEEHPDSQPAYVPLDHVRPAAPEGPAVALIGTDPHPNAWRADDLRDAEAGDVAAAIATAIADGWAVEDRESRQWRRCRWSDVAVLLPARTSLRMLEQALEARDIPYRAETSSLVYGTGEVRDLLMVARAVEDPTDSLAVVAALRSAAFGCGDDDLYRWRHTHHGTWDHQLPLPGQIPHDDPVASGLVWMRELHRQRRWLTASQVLDHIVRDRRLMEVAFATSRPRDLWRRVRFVIDQCRAWEEAGGTTLRGYLEWVKLQGAEGSRVIETVLPETDDEAVRILTVHGAKGLEFPITVLSGMTTAMSRPRSGVQVLFPAGQRWVLRLKKDLETAEFSDYQPIEEQMDRHERLRLLYVAATRARDHLIVSVHRRDSGRGDTSAEVIFAAGGDPAMAEWLSTEAGFHAVAGAGRPAPATAAAAAAPAEWPSLEQWRAEWDRALALGNRLVAATATRLAEQALEDRVTAAAHTGGGHRVDGAASPDLGEQEEDVLAGIRKEPRDIELPPWQKGRYGSAIGRAVHAVLQSVDLESGAGLAGHCASQAAAEAILGREALIEALCRSALRSPLIAEAARRPHWREMYVGIPYGDGVLEGYIDLLYRSEDGLVIVDYKTDSWRNRAELDHKVERYRVQLDAYRRAVEEITGEKQVTARLLFLAPDTPGTAVSVTADSSTGADVVQPE